MSLLAPFTRAWRAALAACALACAGLGAAQEPAPVAPVPVAAARRVAVRVSWGGGQPRAWSGTISVVDASGRPARDAEWRTLCRDPDAAAMVHADGGMLVVHQPRAVATDGVEIVVPDVQGWRIVAAVGPVGAAASATVDVAVADLLVQEVVQPLDGDGNRLAVRPAPGEPLRVSVETADGCGGAATCRPGERVGVTVDALLPARGAGAGVDLRLRLKARSDATTLVEQVAGLSPLPVMGDADPGAVRRPVRFEPVRFEFVLPGREGEWDLELEAVEGAGLGWKRALATCTLPLVTLAATRDAAEPEAWRVIYELDPGSPRLHERLRRLPGVDLPGVGLPQVPLPSLTRPSLPRLPTVPTPQVTLPQMPPLSTMVPRLSGLLAAGHSRVEPHLLGPMLRLPPAEADDEPAWEGIVIAGARPQVPHVVEIEFPPDQNAVVGVAVLELDATGARVEPRHAGGFTVRGAGGTASRLGVHRFVFWPATRHPVILLANQSRTAPALVGHVRILAGPARLPAASPATGRLVHALLADPGLGDFGAGGDVAARVAAVVRSAEAVAAQGAAGAMLMVHAEGAALWPSPATRQAPRWGCGAVDEAGPAAPPDLLAVACRVYEREGLRLVPAIACDAPLAALESELARGGAAAAGIACVGRDGRPRRSGPLATVHYNILDPRVQRAVEELVGELAERLRGASVIDGVALVLPHEGWLHLPGVAWGLDDATFARFRAATGVAESPVGGDRFAARAALVEGTLRERWLEWRAAEIARFHGRIADVLATHDARWSLYVVPTTLCAEGPFAGRFRPVLAAGPGAGDVLREAGLDPVRSTAHRRVVFVTPHVHPSGGPAGAAVVEAGNAAAARSTAAAARRGVVVLEQSRRIDVGAMVPHGPFGGAQPPEPFGLRTPDTGVLAGRPLAEALARVDADVVFDARLALSLPATRSPDRAAVEALPAAVLEPVDGLPVPLVVRTARGDDGTWVHAVNPAGAPVRATLSLMGRSRDAMDMASGEALEAGSASVAVDLPAWGMRTVRIGGDVSVTGARLDYEQALVERVVNRVEQLGRRLAALDRPTPLDVLDNPGFELGGASPAAVAGWELVEARRGVLDVVEAGDMGRAAAFSSTNGLATIRSNPFAPPASGRLSVAVRLRVRDGDPQPPLRVALEGVRDDREYYRFAAVGGLAGGRPLSRDWQLFVLQVDDLPDEGLESLRVRFDLLGPGTVQIDDVRVFDLAFDEAERARLTRQITTLEAAAEAGDVGSCLVALDGHWPRFLERHVPQPSAPQPPAEAIAEPRATQPAQRTGMLDRMWRWWQ